MRTLLVVLAALLAISIFGTAGFFGYQLYIKPKEIEQKEAEAPPPTPPLDYSIPALEKALALRQEGKIVEAREALLNFLDQYPQSSVLAKAKQTLGEINTELVLAPTPGPDKIDYTVVRGDSLVKIASKTKSNAELIMRANNLESIDLQIDQQLLIPQLDIRMRVDREQKTITLEDHGKFFKEYPILSFRGPAVHSKAAVEGKVTDKIALRESKRIPFGDKEYWGSERWILLSVGGLIIRGITEGTNAAEVGGIGIAQGDIEEIFPLVSRGTPVTIQ